MQAGTRSQLQLAAVCSKQAAAVCSKQAATVCSQQAATKSKKCNLHTKNAQAARLQQTMSRKVAATKSRKVAATKSRKVAATKSRKVAATKSSRTNLHTKNLQAATMPQLAAAAKPHACCLFAAIHGEKPLISIRVITIYIFETSNTIEESNMIFHSLTFTRSLGKIENLGLRPRFSTLPSGPCEC